MKLKKLMAIAAGLLLNVCGANAAYTDYINTTNGWTQVTSTSEIATDGSVVYALVASDFDLVVGIPQESSTSQLTYQSISGQPSRKQLWCIESDTYGSGGYAFMNLANEGYFLKGTNAWDLNSNSESKNIANTCYQLTFDSDKLYIQTNSGVNSDNADRYWGDWTVGSHSNGNTLAGNKQAANRVTFKLYKKSLGGVLDLLYPKSFTSKISNPSNPSNAAWTKTLDGTYSYSVYEYYDKSTFTLSQIINNIPNGWYTVGVQGFYRAGGKGSTETTENVFLYAGSNEVALKNINTESYDSKPGTGTYKEVNGKYVPDDMQSASYAMNTSGKYFNSVSVLVTNNSLTLGIKKTGGITYDWTCFNNFTLTYGLGLDVTSLIKNPSFESDSDESTSITGWTNTGSLQTQDNGSFDRTVGTYYVEKWHVATTIDLNQTVSNLPAGKYMVSANIYTEANDVVLYAKGDSEKSVSAGTSLLYSVFTDLSSSGDIKIGVKGTSTASTWTCIDDFHMYRLNADATDYANLKDEIDDAETHTLGFDSGECAPYNNVDGCVALAAAKAINQNVPNTKASVISATQTLADANDDWTANGTEVNAIAYGDFSTYETINGEDMPYGWNLYNGANNHSRIMGGTEGSQNDGLSASSSSKALLIKFNATYGEAVGYTMPLKAAKLYKITFKYCGWGNTPHTNLVMTDPEGNALDLKPAFQPAADDGHADASHWYDFTGYFVSTTAGDYKFNLNKVESGQQQIAIADIEIKTSTDALEFADGSVPTYSAGTYPTVTLDRTFALTDRWYTLCAPFDFPKTAFAEVKVLSGVTGSGESASLSFSTPDGDDITAGTPCLVKPSKEDATLSLTSVAMDPATTAGTTEVVDITFVGTFSATSLDATNNSNAWVVSNNKLWNVTSTVSVPAYCGYFEVSSNGVKSLSMSFDDDIETGIRTIENGELKIENAPIYNLAGQRVSKAQKGIYIVNGKKVMVK